MLKNSLYQRQLILTMVQKNLNFDIKISLNSKIKVVYLPLEKEPPNIMKINDTDTNDERGKKLILNGMARDYYQRENLRKGLTKIK